MDTDLKVVKGKKRVGIKSGFQAARSAAKNLSPQLKRKKTKSSVALMKVYPNELEVQPEFEGFSEWLQTFELYRGKQADEIFDDESRMVGKFKVELLTYFMHKSRFLKTSKSSSTISQIVLMSFILGVNQNIQIAVAKRY